VLIEYDLARVILIEASDMGAFFLASDSGCIFTFEADTGVITQLANLAMPVGDLKVSHGGYTTWAVLDAARKMIRSCFADDCSFN
jgi:hypothetical protein